MTLGFFGRIAFGLAGGRQCEGSNLRVAIVEDPTDAVGKIFGAVADGESIPLRQLHDQPGATFPIGAKPLNIEDLLGAVELRLGKALHAPGIAAKLLKQIHELLRWSYVTRDA